MWFGARKGGSGIWYWNGLVTGDVSGNESDWMTNEPDGDGCGAMVVSLGWDDIACDNERHFLCEKN